MDADRKLIAVIQDGISLESQPWSAVARNLDISEESVLAKVKDWLDRGIIRRFGLVVRHRSLGYIHNAMVVWDVPDEEVASLGQRISKYPFVTLCYRRQRSLPIWPYNLYCMVHGTDRQEVVGQIKQLNHELGLGGCGHNVLFSKRCFKQRGAKYE